MGKQEYSIPDCEVLQLETLPGVMVASAESYDMEHFDPEFED